MSIDNRQNTSALPSWRRQASLWLPPLLLMAVIYFLSAQPNLSSGLGIWDLIGRKLLHMAEFGLLAAALYRAMQDAVSSPLRRLVVAVAVTLLYAVSDELHQNYVEGRHASALDVLVDGVGVAIAVTAIYRRHMS